MMDDQRICCPIAISDLNLNLLIWLFKSDTNIGCFSQTGNKHV